MDNEKSNELKIALDEATAQGIYANLAIIAHSSSEFIMDFVRVVPGVKSAKVQSRIIMTPEHTKRLLRALEDNIRRYEAQHGEIRLPEQRTFNMMDVLKKGEA